MSFSASGLPLPASVMLRSASDSAPVCRASSMVSTWFGVSSSVAVLPTTTFWPFFSSTCWSIASTRTSLRMVSLTCTSVPVGFLRLAVALR